MSGLELECRKSCVLGLRLSEEGVARRRGGGGGGGCLLEFTADAEFDGETAEGELFHVLEPGLTLVLLDLEDWPELPPVC